MQPFKGRWQMTCIEPANVWRRRVRRDRESRRLLDTTGWEKSGRESFPLESIRSRPAIDRSTADAPPVWNGIFRADDGLDVSTCVFDRGAGERAAGRGERLVGVDRGGMLDEGPLRSLLVTGVIEGVAA